MRFNEELLTLNRSKRGQIVRQPSNTSEKPYLNPEHQRQQDLETYMQTTSRMNAFIAMLGFVFERAEAGQIRPNRTWITRPVDSAGYPILSAETPLTANRLMLYQVLEHLAHHQDRLKDLDRSKELYSLLREQIFFELHRQPLINEPEFQKQDRLVDILYFIAGYTHKEPVHLQPVPDSIKKAQQSGSEITTLFVELLTKLPQILVDESHPSFQHAIDILSLLNSFELKMPYPIKNVSGLFTPYWMGLLSQEDMKQGLQLQKFLTKLIVLGVEELDSGELAYTQHNTLFHQCFETMVAQNYQIALRTPDMKKAFGKRKNRVRPISAIHQDIVLLFKKYRSINIYFSHADKRDPSYQDLNLRYSKYNISFFDEKDVAQNGRRTLYFHLTLSGKEFIEKRNDDLPGVLKLAFSVSVDEDGISFSTPVLDQENIDEKLLTQLLGVVDTLLQSYFAQLALEKPPEESETEV